MPKNYTSPNRTLHWDADASPTIAISPEVSQAVLLKPPAAPATMTLRLPANPADGDWYEYADPLGLIGASYPLHIATTDGSTIDGAASPFISTTANSGGKLVYVDDALLGATGGWMHTAVSP